MEIVVISTMLPASYESDDSTAIVLSDDT